MRRLVLFPLSRTERGSVLAIVPAGFLVLMILAAIAVDSAVAFLGQRQLANALEGAANDAAGAAVAQGGFYRTGRITLDPAVAAIVVCQSLAAQDGGSLHHLEVSMAVAGPEIGLRGTATVDEIFGRLLPGLHQREVSALVAAEAARSPAAAPPPPTNYQPLSC